MEPKIPKAGADGASSSSDSGSLLSIVLPAVAILAAVVWKFYIADAK
jgi:hypothetical protein